MLGLLTLSGSTGQMWDIICLYWSFQSQLLRLFINIPWGREFSGKGGAALHRVTRKMPVLGELLYLKMSSLVWALSPTGPHVPNPSWEHLSKLSGHPEAVWKNCSPASVTTHQLPFSPRGVSPVRGPKWVVSFRMPKLRGSWPQVVSVIDELISQSAKAHLGHTSHL